MEKLIEVLSMGGYGAYVWPSYLITALLMAAMVFLTLRAHKRERAALARLRDEVADPNP